MDSRRADAFYGDWRDLHVPKRACYDVLLQRVGAVRPQTVSAVGAVPVLFDSFSHRAAWQARVPAVVCSWILARRLWRSQLQRRGTGSACLRMLTSPALRMQLDDVLFVDRLYSASDVRLHYQRTGAFISQRLDSHVRLGQSNLRRRPCCARSPRLLPSASATGRWEWAGSLSTCRRLLKPCTQSAHNFRLVTVPMSIGLSSAHLFARAPHQCINRPSQRCGQPRDNVLNVHVYWHKQVLRLATQCGSALRLQLRLGILHLRSSGPSRIFRFR